MSTLFRFLREIGNANIRIQECKKKKYQPAESMSYTLLFVLSKPFCVMILFLIFAIWTKSSNILSVGSFNAYKSTYLVENYLSDLFSERLYFKSLYLKYYLKFSALFNLKRR